MTIIGGVGEGCIGEVKHYDRSRIIENGLTSMGLKTIDAHS